MFFGRFFAVVVSFCLVACGGGGGGGGASSPSGPVASTSVFQIRAENANAYVQGSYSFTISGTISGYALSGGGTITDGPVTSGTFEGVTALQQTSTVAGTVIANGNSIPLSSTSTSYIDSNYLPLGGVGSEYVVYGAVNIPVTALVNDTGVAYTASRYTNSSKSTLVGTATVTYVLQPDTASTAIFVVTSVSKDTSGVITSTETSRTRITPTGGFTRLNSTAVYPNGNTFVFNY